MPGTIEHRALMSPPDTEWEEFLGHFERRKVSTGICGRPLHSLHPRARMPEMLDALARPRLIEIRDNLTARITEAEHEGWLGEAEGLAISLADANNKLALIDRPSRRTPVDLGIPSTKSQQ